MSLFPFRARNGWFLVPLFAPFLGAIVGTIIYQMMVGFHVEGEVRDRLANRERENVPLNDTNSNTKSKEMA